MKERGILFSAPMVRAILAEAKTQTRRVAKFAPLEPGLNMQFTGLRTEHRANGEWVLQSRDGATNLNDRTHPLRCPYGQPGDRLWVRETWASVPRRVGGMADKRNPACSIIFRADGEQNAQKWNPSIFMPRKASRITLEITGVRVERLQNISAVDARAEGIESAPCLAYPGEKLWKDYQFPSMATSEWFKNPVNSYRSLWEVINGPASWVANPWVWVVEFKRVTP